MNESSLMIDNGSGMVKAGFSGEDAPCCVFQCIIGRPKYKQIMPISNNKNIYIGDDAKNKRGILKITYPINHGIVSNWDDMEKIWEYIFYNKLDINTQETKVMLTEVPLNPKINREKMIECMFEKFNVPATFCAIQGVLSLYASGRITGTVLDIGDGVTHIIPIYHGYMIPGTVNRYDLAGRDITNYLCKLLEAQGHKFTSSSDKEIVREIKEKMIFCSLDNRIEPIMHKPYMLPDGNVINLGDELWRSSEILFDAELNNKEIPGIHISVFDSIKKTQIDMRKDLLSNIVLSGGTTMIKNFDLRLEQELNFIKAEKMKKIKVICPNDRKYSVWLGGSILSSLSTFDNSWIRKHEYEEHGIKIVHEKCM